MEQHDLATRIARLEAIEAIRNLKHRYLRACDAKDPKGFRDAFIAHGADCDYERMGKFDDADGITEVFTRVALSQRDGKHLILDMHHALHAEITVLSETEATGQWTLRFRQLNLHDRTEKVAAIEYDDAYRVENGEWKMSKLHARTLWAFTQPLSDDVAIIENFG